MPTTLGLHYQILLSLYVQEQWIPVWSSKIKSENGKIFNQFSLLDAYSTALKSPGPGTYPNIPSINDKGKYFNSKFKSSGASLFNPRTSDRFGPNFSKGEKKIYNNY